MYTNVPNVCKRLYVGQYFSIVLLWLAHNVGRLLIKAGCWPAQDAIPDTIQHGHKSFYHKRETVISNTRQHWKFWKVMVCLFPSSNSIMSCVRYQMKPWLKMFAWANLCGYQQSFLEE